MDPDDFSVGEGGLEDIMGDFIFGDIEERVDDAAVGDVKVDIATPDIIADLAGIGAVYGGDGSRFGVTDRGELGDGVVKRMDSVWVVMCLGD